MMCSIIGLIQHSVYLTYSKKLTALQLVKTFSIFYALEVINLFTSSSTTQQNARSAVFII